MFLYTPRETRVMRIYGGGFFSHGCYHHSLDTVGTASCTCNASQVTHGRIMYRIIMYSRFVRFCAHAVTAACRSMHAKEMVGIQVLHMTEHCQKPQTSLGHATLCAGALVALEQRAKVGVEAEPAVSAHMPTARRARTAHGVDASHAQAPAADQARVAPAPCVVAAQRAGLARHEHTVPDLDRVHVAATN
jgi:hypothetical protein